MSAVSTMVRRLVRARDLGRCQRCNRPCPDGAYNLQHRRPRGSGSSRLAHINQAENLIVLCGSSSTDPAGCHYWVESNRERAREKGWAVRLNAHYLPSYVPAQGRDVDGNKQWHYFDGFDRIPVPRDTAVMRLVALGIRKDGM